MRCQVDDAEGSFQMGFNRSGSMTGTCRTKSCSSKAKERVQIGKVQRELSGC